MTISNYFKERWLTFFWASISFGFAYAVYKLDTRLGLTQANATYIGTGLILFFLAFVIVDYLSLKQRFSKLRTYGELNAPAEPSEEFVYPLDQAWAQVTANLARAYERHKAEVATKSEEQLEFVTQWVHDVKVPIAAARLVLENHQESIPVAAYQSLDQEIFRIEQSVQRVFYQVKSESLREDYKIARTNTRELISATLKAYSNFFSYKKLQISLSGGNYQVLTDAKWSGYILSQLIANAVKYTPPHGQISIATTRSADGVTISVQNSGQGILPQDIGQVFSRGYTSSEGRATTQATGYGLYLAHKLSRIMGHTLTVQSQYGEYARFNLTFKQHSERVM